MHVKEMRLDLAGSRQGTVADCCEDVMMKVWLP
jgi:hypothetical protein